MNDYEAKQQRRRERLEARADRLRGEGESRIKRARDMASVIPFGQPILIGHHSEKSDRAYRGRIDNNFRKGFETLSAADEVARRAESVGTGGISSDDPDSIVKLSSKLESLKASQRQMTAINAAWRKAGKPKADDAAAWQQIADAPAVMMNVNDLSRLRADMARDYCHRAPFTYQLSNNSGNIRRIEQRIAELGTMADRETKETLHNSGVRVVENAEENRIQLFFDGKPADDIRAMLKQNGFRWSPMAGAWQRQLNGAGRYAAQYVLGRLPQMEG